MRKSWFLVLLLTWTIGCQGTDAAPAHPAADATSTTGDDSSQPDTNTTDTQTQPAGLAIHDTSPQEGRTAGGELVVIEGTGFVEGTRVFFGSLMAPEVTVYSAVVIHARTPGHQPGTVDIRVVKPSGEDASVADAYLFRDQLTLSGLEPNQGPTQGGTPITVYGSGFTPDTQLVIGGRGAIDTVVVDSQTLLALTPPGLAGDANVILSSSLGTSHQTNAFRYTVAPTIDALKPLTGPMNSPSTLTVSGSGYTQSTRAWVGEEEALVLAITPNTLTLEVSGGPEGPADVRVATSDGDVLSPNAFTFTLVPEPSDFALLNLFPASADRSGGQQISLIAYGLSTTADTTVQFGEIEAAIVSIDPFTHRLVVLAPAADAPSLVTVTVHIDGQSDVLPDSFLYTETPNPTAATPASGSMSGGTSLQIQGTQLGGDIDVFVGALPATIVSQTASLLEVITPPGSAGAADIRVLGPGGQGVLEGAYTYLPDNGPELYGLEPAYGAIAGNTLVRLYGAGFDASAIVRFAKQPLGKVEVVSSTEIQIRTPRADEPTTLDVTVEQAGQALSIKDGYSYFDPYSPYGGSWGPPIHGTVNITVLDIYTTDPIADAFVMMWADPTTPFKGVTDDRGQITFSGPGLEGPQMVTASKVEHTAMSVVEYDAENVTVHLIPFNPSSPGGGGGGTMLPPGEIVGHVSGLGKYVLVPPQTCEYMMQKGLAGAEGTKSCLACEEDADCGNTALCVNVAQDGNYCAEICTQNSDCPDGYLCSGMSGSGLACLPDPGTKAAFCQTTNHELWEDPPTPHVPTLPMDDGTRAWTDDNGDYWMKSRLGELAVLCFGGVVRDPEDKAGSFVPLVMGVARHVLPVPGEQITDIDVELTIPLTKSVPLRLDGAPLVYNNPNTGTQTTTFSTLRVALDFGSDGYWNAATLEGAGQSEFVLTRQPAELVDELDGVTYIFHASVQGDEFASSQTQAYQVRVLEVDRLFSFADGTWAALNAGIPRDIHAMWANNSEDVWAVGADGLIAHGKNGAWFPQYSPVTTHLHGIFGTVGDHAVAVGSEGTALVFDGATWSQEETGSTAALYDVWGSAPDHLYAVGESTVLHRGVEGWTSVGGAPNTTLRAAWGPTPTTLWTVGDDGRLWQYNGSWTQKKLVDGIALHDIAGLDAETVWIVGDLGTVLRREQNGSWLQVDVPTAEHLRAVYVTAAEEVFVVGARGTLLRFDGQGWTVEKAPKYGGDLQAVCGFENSDPNASGHTMTTVVAAGTQVVSLGPMLSFPEIGDPAAVGSFSFHLDWWAAPSAAPTFNFVQMLGGPTLDFPFWWTVVEAATQDITFPNLMEAHGINPFIPGNALMHVTRVYRPGTTVNNFDFWDMYQKDGWTSWSTNGVLFSPMGDSF